MQSDPRAFLWDAQAAALAILDFTRGLDAETYSHNVLVQAAVERKFEIIGEALNQLSHANGQLLATIPDVPQIVAFRNQLIHGYAKVRSETVWNIVQTSLPRLLASIQKTLDGMPDESAD